MHTSQFTTTTTDPLSPHHTRETSPLFKMAGWIYRENRVPAYQKEYQKHDGVRLWMKSRGRWMIPAYKVVLYTSIGSSLYMMGRLVLGHKTWFGKN
ncbi:hypothetical protein DPSP01_010193 [Paraphaeosphaeria sporulosa]